MASAEQVHAAGYTRAVGECAEYRVRLRAIVVRLDTEIKEIGIVVAAVQIGVTGEPHAVRGDTLVQIPVIGVADIAAEVHLPFVADLQLRC